MIDINHITIDIDHVKHGDQLDDLGPPGSAIGLECAAADAAMASR
jgi:hypothetical protein